MYARSLGVTFEAYFSACLEASYAGLIAEVSIGRLMFGPSAYAIPQ
jgi:hypothetical protein